MFEPVDREASMTDDLQAQFVMMDIRQRLRIWRDKRILDIKYNLWLALDINYDIIKSINQNNSMQGKLFFITTISKSSIYIYC